MVTPHLSNYQPLGVLLIVGVILALALATLAGTVTYQRFDLDKLSPYECGFSPFGDRESLDVQYYLVAVVFLVFDLELVYLLPFTLVWADLGAAPGFVMLGFYCVLTFGLWLEWSRGLLE